MVRLHGYRRFRGLVVAHRHGVFGGCPGSDITSIAVPGILYAVSAPLFIWSGQVDLIPLQQALAGLLLTIAAVIIAVRLPREAP
jgi:hypothetical protein